MSDENYSQISPPTLSSTKLHMIQSYDVGGVYNRLLTIHTHHRSALKIFLRVYESLGGTSQTFSDYLPVLPYNEDNTVNEDFVLPSKTDTLRELTEDDVNQVAPRDDEEWTQLIRDKLVLEKQTENQAGIIVGLLDSLHRANSVAMLGQKLQESISDLMWDGLQLYGQTDLVIKEAREAKIEEYVTTSFKSSLHSAAKDRESRRDKNREDKLLHHRLDKLVKEEARTNNKVWFYT